jgi:lipoprotein-anchoring transpeptidase ErfK/SrfK
VLKTTATGSGHRLLSLRRDDLQLTTHYYAVALHAVRRYSAAGAVGASDGGRHDDPITVAADHERVAVPPSPKTVPPTDKAAVDVTEEKSTSFIRNGTTDTTTTYNNNNYYTPLLLLLPLLQLLLLLLLHLLYFSTTYYYY